VKFSMFEEMSWSACKMSYWVDVELEKDDPNPWGVKMVVKD